MLIERDATPTLERLSQGFPVVWLTGPRQSGKTTLARATRPDLPYVNLERPDERSFAQEDPRGFLDRFPSGAILDEVQHAPELTSWLQVQVDADQRMGRWWLTGSQQPAIAAGISQSLAGRVARLELLPLSARELLRAERLPDELDSVLFTGGYPALFDRAVSPTDWLGNYAATYIERDVRQLTNVRDLNTFTRFVRLCAARSGQLLNMSSLGNDAGVSVVTAKAWLSILRATYVIDLVEPYHANFTSRVVKTPKLIFLDVGLMAYFLGINAVNQISAHPLRGALFETWGITEQIKRWRNGGNSQHPMFLRDKHGLEIDLLYAEANTLHAVEFKSGATVSSDWSKTIQRWQDRTETKQWSRPTVVYGGQDDHVRNGVQYLGWRSYAAR